MELIELENIEIGENENESDPEKQNDNKSRIIKENQ